MKCFLVYGENFLERKDFIESVLPHGDSKVLNGLDSIKWNDVLVEIESGGGFFTTTNNILVKNFRKIKNDKVGEKNFLKFLSENIKGFDGTLVLEAEKLEKNSFTRGITKLVSAHEFKLPYDNQMANWIRNRAKNSYGLELDEETAHYIKLLTTNIFEVDSELKKVKIFLGDDIRVDTSIVSQVVGAHRIESVFAIQDAILDRDMNRLVLLYNNLIDNGVSAEYIISVITGFVNKLFFISFSYNMAPKDIASSIGANLYIMTKNNWIPRVKRHYKSDDLLKVFDIFLTLEYNIKSGQIKNDVLLERLVYGFY